MFSILMKDLLLKYPYYKLNESIVWVWDHRGLDRMVVGFITTYAISAYHTDVVRSNLEQGEVYIIMR